MEGDMVGNRDLAPDGRFGFVDGHLQMVRGHTCLFSSTARNLWTGIQPRPTPHRPIRAGSRANDTTRNILLPSRLARLFPSELVSAVRTGERMSLRATVSELSFLWRVIAHSIRSCANRRNRQTQARTGKLGGQLPAKTNFDATYSPVWLRAKVIAWRNKLVLSKQPR